MNLTTSLSNILSNFYSLDFLPKQRKFIIYYNKVRNIIYTEWIKIIIIDIIKGIEKKEQITIPAVFEVKKEYDKNDNVKIKVRINKEVITIAEPIFFTKNELIKAIKNTYSTEYIKMNMNKFKKQSFKDFNKEELINFINYLQ